MKNSDEKYDELDKEFHKIIATSASNHINEGIIEPLMTFFYETYHNISAEHRNRMLTIEQHTAIYQALNERDPFAAHKAMYQHLDFVRKRIQLTKANKKRIEDMGDG
jgi:DNA-binding FadR family transcriptional regulator